jgi:uracil-DNA glycosylase family 4
MVDKNLIEALEFYHDNGLNEIISDFKQNYFLQKEVIKSEVIKKKITKEEIEKKAINITEEKVISFIKPVFSTSDAISTLARKIQNNQEENNMAKIINQKSEENKEAFISLNEIIAKAQKMAADAKNLAELRLAVENFDGCNLKKMATNTVFCDGNPNSKVMVIGEAPGNHEDLQGIPFCGDSGKVLDAMFKAINMTREENLYITNVIFWRPPGNRRPTDEELAICKPFVERHIQLVNPEVIILVGATAMSAIVGINDPISGVRGKFMDFSPKFLLRTIKTFAIFHPSYLMRQSTKKKLAWLDMLNLEKFLKNL